ncbi:glycosyltransferase involved in cell wall biosynthesis [Flavobacteriaceae bacterium MAR_2010_105]|nr:glycosyltransferase involved in cell wall biosynthesis [Flavobacteriaceae bacterium MAR_2010_105]
MSKKLLIIGFVWPEPKSSAAGSRMMQLIYSFLEKDYSITFASASACAKSDNAFDLPSIGVAQVSIELNKLSFDRFIKQLNPDVVLFDRFMIEEQFGWRVAEYCPKAVRILDTEDLHGLRKGRAKAIKDGIAFENSYLLNDTAKREIASIYRCDLSLIISEAEIEICSTFFKVPKSLLLYMPFILNRINDEQIEKLNAFEKRTHFISIGNFLHEPNYNAVLYLKETIWPLIRLKLPNAELHIYGAYSSQKVNQLHNEKEGFLIKGFAADVHVVMKQAKVCLAPLRFGAGLKGKLIDAMLNGTPCVMTSIAAEGMFGKLEPNGFITDDPEDFALKAVELYGNSSVWEEKQSNGFKIVNERFQKEGFHKKMHMAIQETTQHLHEKRLDNFTGQMLLHHSLQSTKYLAKWIEEKNT